MMKVQSSRVLESLQEDYGKAPSRIVPMSRAKARTCEPLVIDGPFAETKESCSYVALLARYGKRDRVIE